MMIRHEIYLAQLGFVLSTPGFAVRHAAVWAMESAAEMYFSLLPKY